MHIIVTSTLHPKWLHGPRAPLIDCQSVGEVDDFVLRAMDDKDRRSYSWNLVDTRECIKKTCPLDLWEEHPHSHS